MLGPLGTGVSTATMTPLTTGDLLLDTMHNVRVTFVSVSADTAIITRINDTDIPAGVSLLVHQDPLIPINQNQPFVDDLPMGAMRVYDESMLGVGQRAVFTSFDILSASFGPRLVESPGNELSSCAAIVSLHSNAAYAQARTASWSSCPRTHACATRYPRASGRTSAAKCCWCSGATAPSPRRRCSRSRPAPAPP